MNPSQAPYQASNYGYTPPEKPRSRWLIRGALIMVGLLIVGGATLLVFHKKPAATVTPVATTSSTTSRALTTDEKQKNGAQVMIAAVEKYASDHNGIYPGDSATLQALTTDSQTDTLGHIFIYKQQYSTSDLPTSFRSMYYYGGYKCKGREAVAGSMRSVAIIYVLSNGTYACADN